MSAREFAVIGREICPMCGRGHEVFGYINHGSIAAYKITGCRCDDCRTANAIYVTRWRHRTGRTVPGRTSVGHRGGRKPVEVRANAALPVGSRLNEHEQVLLLELLT